MRGLSERAQPDAFVSFQELVFSPFPLTLKFDALVASIKATGGQKLPVPAGRQPTPHFRRGSSSRSP